jgi:hypothetical protein
MAQEILVSEILTSEMISAGAELAPYFLSSQLPIDGLLWLYHPESETWRFVVVTPEVKTFGLTKVYEDIRSIVSNIPAGKLIVPINDIFAVDSNDPLIAALRPAMVGRQNVKISGSLFGRVLIEGAYVYTLS